MERPRTTPSRRFPELLSQLAEEHELELSGLRAENERLRRELQRFHGGPAPPEVEVPKTSSPVLTLDTAGTSSLELVVHSCGGIPEDLLQQEALCQLSFSLAMQEVTSEWLQLQREAWTSGPNMVGQGEQTWEAHLAVPCKLATRVSPEYIRDVIYVDLCLPGRKMPLATAPVKIGQRQRFEFDKCGYLEAEVLIDGMQRQQQPVNLNWNSETGSKETMGSKEKPTIRSLSIKPKTAQRLRKIFKVDNEQTKMVVPRDLQKAMKASKKTTSFNTSFKPHEMEELVQELKRIHMTLFAKKEEEEEVRESRFAMVAWKSFMECLLLENLPSFSTGQASLRLFILQKALLGDDLPTTGASRAIVQAYEQVRKPVTYSHRLINLITLCSTALIAVSFICTGVALDYAQSWNGWKFVDSFFAFFFMVESVLKFCLMGPRYFCCGREKWWNLWDTGISLAAIAEVTYNFILRGLDDTTPTRVALTLRVLRLARVSVYMKLLNTPLLQELSNIVQGFMVAVPSLFWVLVTLTVVIYVAALAMRATVMNLSGSYLGPDQCGSADLLNIDATPPANCGGLHDLYGQEYCGTVLGCMFTIFRCILGDCTSSAGRNLALMWSAGYGVQFDIFYSLSMVCVIFGMFNIITAIFVEATMNGLKDSETERKYAQAYESDYMTEQLAKLVMAITKEVEEMRKEESARTTIAQLTKSLSWGSGGSATSLDKELYLTEMEFISAIRNSEVRMLLDDLDVVVEPRPGIFEAFSQEEDGTVSMSELISCLMSFRGELQKVDVLTTKKYLENLTKELHNMHTMQAQMITRMGQLERAPPRPAPAPERPPQETSRRLVVAVPRRRAPKW